MEKSKWCAKCVSFHFFPPPPVTGKEQISIQLSLRTHGLSPPTLKTSSTERERESEEEKRERGKRERGGGWGRQLMKQEGKARAVVFSNHSFFPIKLDFKRYMHSVKLYPSLCTGVYKHPTNTEMHV